MMGHCVRDAPFFVIKKCQIEVHHSKVIATMEEIVSRYNGVAHAETSQEHQIRIVETGG